MVFICPGFLNHPFRLSLSKPGRLGLFADLESLPVRSAGAGLSPRQATHFSLLRQRKVSKRKATPSLRPLRGAKGQTCGGAVAGCAAELTSLLRSSVRTTAASQITKHARSDARATPQPPRRRRSQRGWGAEQPTAKQPFGPSLRSAQSAQRVALAPARRGPSAAMARVDVLRVPFTMRRGAQGVGRHGRASARASCSDSLRLFERSAQRAASSAARPTTEHRRLPAAKRRDAACRVAFSLVTFFWRSKRKLLRRRAHTPASSLNQGTQSKLANEPRRPGFDRLSPHSQ